MNWKKYLTVTKPGIVVGNLMVTIGAYLFASDLEPEFLTFLGLTIGTICVIAASCVLNNYLDRSIDASMERTSKRPSVTGAISLRIALPYAGVLLALGSWLLWNYTNAYTCWVGLFGAFWYVVVYGIVKRTTPYSTLIGTISGATPPLAGYLAAAGRFDVVAWCLFALLVFWQMPHFYAIAIFRAKEYRQAGLPLLNLQKGLSRTVFEMRIYVTLFCMALVVFLFESYITGISFFAMFAVALFWLRQHNEIASTEPNAWARRVFRTSLSILPVYSLLLAIDPWVGSWLH